MPESGKSICGRAFSLGIILALCLSPIGHAKAAKANATLQKLVDETASDNQFNGVALIGKGGKTLYANGYGKANFETGAASSPDTLYQTGSFSKWVASVVVLKLVDQGKLSLTAPVSDYLPNYRRDTGAKITLHHLLSHTSGVPNGMGAAFGKDPALASYAGLSTDQAMAKYASGDLAFAPGERFDYSHSNWLIVEAVIEHVTGKSYRQNVSELLLEPLRLKRSGIMPRDFATLDHAAQGYVALTPAPQPAPRERTFPIPDFIGPFGGFYTAAPDMLKLLDGVYGGKLLSAGSREKLWQVNVADEGYAYGGRVKTIPLGGRDRRVSWNNNSNGPYKSLEIRVDDGNTVLLFNNTKMDQGKLNEMGERLLKALYR